MRRRRHQSLLALQWMQSTTVPYCSQKTVSTGAHATRAQLRSGAHCHVSRTPRFRRICVVWRSLPQSKSLLVSSPHWTQPGCHLVRTQRRYSMFVSFLIYTHGFPISFVAVQLLSSTRNQEWNRRNFVSLSRPSESVCFADILFILCHVEGQKRKGFYDFIIVSKSFHPRIQTHSVILLYLGIGNISINNIIL